VFLFQLLGISCRCLEKELWRCTLKRCCHTQLFQCSDSNVILIKS
jgi:hypothetical protein